MNVTRETLIRTASEVFGWETPREGQLEAMTAVAQGRDVLCVMPTGHGKSAVYQVPALALPGVAVVISPLVALQRDQADAINAAAGRTRAYVVNSGQSQAQINDAWAAVEDPDEEQRAKFLFLAPEQVAKEDVAQRLKSLDVSLLVIDEAHCVSAWGHDFRPDYLQLGALVQTLGKPVVALTATAAPPVRTEIAGVLQLKDPFLIAQGFDRPNLHLAVRMHVESEDKRRAVVDSVPDLEHPGLVYVATRKEAEQYAEDLEKAGLRAAAFHSGRPSGEREDVHRRFLADELDVVVATTAFGMGIDKPNVRYVVHAGIPDSVDSYYQEIGRGGRDGKPATAILHYRPEDLGLRRFFASNRPSDDDLRQLFAVLRAQNGTISQARLRETLNLSARKLAGLLNLLYEAGAVTASKKGYKAGTMSPDEAVSAAAEYAERRENIDQSRVDMARQYAETSGCRRQFLLGYFGENMPDPCGNCDNCEKAAAAADVAPEDLAELSPDDAADLPFPLQSPVTHTEWGPGVVMSYEDETVTVLFEAEGYKTLSVDLVLEKDLLQPLNQ
ncbi:RecQ family ATP-dependent DNA helicase [Arthrobacter sp. zg-Y750]|uniref:RecQ family ATP-dependent DNA helicase n=1 Tax=Arthrobacter sp. zg-Y750 TaxID=2894189 RepID=UPI001E307355|nr:ATP-dependent DNA helicase RecQ [Arthrobacter sp. zg-Y750]MCC9178406.1 ATP-dependent DNA helicase [Arthrobacter sp. zg-Y750]